MMITFGMFSMGDLICQKLEHKINLCEDNVVKTSYDFGRATRLGMIIGSTVAPMNYFYTKNIHSKVRFSSVPKPVNAFFRVAAQSAFLMPL